jgi:hypothetical protein
MTAAALTREITLAHEKNKGQDHLTLSGVLMEDDYTRNP